MLGHFGTHYPVMRCYNQHPPAAPWVRADSSPQWFQADSSDPSFAGTLPAGANIWPLLRPTVRPADVRVGLTASRAFQILTNRKAEEMRLLIDAFEGRFEGWEEAVHAPGTAAMETMSWPNEVVQLSP